MRIEQAIVIFFILINLLLVNRVAGQNIEISGNANVGIGLVTSDCSGNTAGKTKPAISGFVGVNYEWYFKNGNSFEVSPSILFLRSKTKSNAKYKVFRMGRTFDRLSSTCLLYTSDAADE